MRRFVLPVAVAAFALLATFHTSAAVEVFVKTPTKLYDAQGKVVQDVTAGYPFEADSARGTWVYGFLKTKGGGRRGFIPIDALELSDDDRRALNIPITTGKSAEPILLRYTLKPDERQVYELDVAENGSVGSGKGRITRHITTKASIQIGYSYVGTGGAKGAYTADARYHKLRVAMEFIRGIGTKVRVEGHERGVSLFVDGQRVFSGKWEDLPGDDGPDFGTLLKTTAHIRISDRHELLDLGELEEAVGQTAILGGIPEIANVVYPQDEIRGGDSWQVPFETTMDDPASDGELLLTGTTTYTVLERTEHMKRPCVRLRMELSATNAQPAPQLTRRFVAAGIEYIDEATGVPLNAEIAVTHEAGGTQGENIIRSKSSITISLRYAGTEVK